MLQTDRKTETTKRTAQDREQDQRRQSRETKLDPALALQAILSGGSWEQIPTDSMLELSHQMGNAALQEALALRHAVPENGPTAFPGTPCETAPVGWDGVGRPLPAAPDFGAMSPMGAMTPMEV